jgi:hypothetical protein
MYAGQEVTRADLGLPEKWTIIEHWIDDSKDVVKNYADPVTPPTLKNSEIPVLQSYEKNAPHSFWSAFPKNYNKKVAKTVNVKILKKLIQKCWFSWTLPQRMTAKRALRQLQGFSPVVLKKDLKGVKTKNANSATANGRFITDAICSWVKKGFVVGPFDSPPFEDFRINPLMAAVQKTKVRPIMNLSSPKGNSLNDAIDMTTVQKINMSSPKLFAEELVKAGKGALFSKSDIVDAYKLIPNAVQQWRLFGFQWLGKYFFDKAKVFGSKEAPAGFDSLPETIVNIVCCLYKIPKRNVQRQLDDVPMVAAKESGLTERFHSAYKDICRQINIPLAEQCENHEKAFGPTTYGTVLGIKFDSITMEWSISKEKELSLQETIDFFLNNKTCTLKQAQKLQGKLANFAQTMDFMKSYKYNVLSLLNKFKGQEGTKIIPLDMKRDLWVWKKCISDSKEGLPIRNLIDEPPLFPLTIISDAAGAALEWVGGKSINKTIPNDRGAASVWYQGKKVLKTVILSWPKNLLMGEKTRNGVYFGTKSGTLETIGLLLPFISYPKDLVGKHILLQVDNTSLGYGWEKHYCKNDPETSLLLRALHVVESLLSCRIYVKYVRRRSNTMARLVDDLSRKSTTTAKTLQKTKNEQMYISGGALVEWLKNPVLDWTLPEKIVAEIKEKLK